MRVLHIEDEESILTLVAETLRGKATVVGVRTLAAAKEAMKLDNFDIILLDLALPDSSGTRAIEELTALYDIPIVVFSGNPDETILPRALEAGAEDYICKPVIVATRIIERLNFAHARFKRRQKLTKSNGGGKTPRVRRDPARFEALKPFLSCAIAR